MLAMFRIIYTSLSLPADFVPIMEYISFGPVAMSGDRECLSITLMDNDLYETTETFSFAISPTSEFVTVNSNSQTSTVTVLDDEGELSLLEK